MNKPKLWLPKAHHSLVDWDIDPATWSITTDDFVSPPSSILWFHAATGYSYQLCRDAATTQLPEGKIVTYLRYFQSGTFLAFLFRNTAAVGTTDRANCYQLLLSLSGGLWYLREMVAGGLSREWTRNKSVQIALDWYRFRASWWLIGWDLTVMLEKWDGENWIQEGDVVTVTDPLYGEEAIQRVGLNPYRSLATNKLWVDDTEIWERT